MARQLCQCSGDTGGHEWFVPSEGGGCPAVPVSKSGLCHCPTSMRKHAYNTETCPSEGPMGLPRTRSTRPSSATDYVADVYAGGGKREENGDRPRFDLLWTESQPLERQMLHRDAVWYQKGAAKYGERNWERFDGESELVRAQASLGRHYAAFMLGLTDEDHAAAVRANVQFIEYIRERIAAADAAGEGAY